MSDTLYVGASAGGRSSENVPDLMKTPESSAKSLTSETTSLIVWVPGVSPSASAVKTSVNPS